MSDCVPTVRFDLKEYRLQYIEKSNVDLRLARITNSTAEYRSIPTIASVSRLSGVHRHHFMVVIMNNPLGPYSDRL